MSESNHQSDQPDEAAITASTEVELGLILDRFLTDLEAGRHVDPEDLVAAHPHLAGPLRACLEVMVLPLSDRGTSSAPVGPVNGTKSPRSSGSTLSLGGNAELPRIHLSDPSDAGVAPVLTTPGLPIYAGRYQVLGEIARGGMGAVLRARDADLGRELALKVLLRPHRDQTDLRNRFIEEAQIGAQLQHPGIVPVYELSAFPDSRPFLAMKLVRGRTLSALLAERSSPADDLPRFLAIFEQVCQTVAYAHSRRVIHRDLKPSNVMVGSFGEVQVMDWGLAKVLPEGGVADERKERNKAEALTEVRTLRTEGSGSSSQAGSILGTPAYMAPEQARGEIDHIDERADVFGLGAILCEILTGRPPFRGASRSEVQAQAARADFTEAHARLEACAADDQLTQLARDCISPQPTTRPRDAGVVARRMTAYATGAQERFRAAELAAAKAEARATEEQKRRRLTVGLAASLVGLVLSVGAAGAWWKFDKQAKAARVDKAILGVDLLRAEAERAGDDVSKWSLAREATSYLRLMVAETPDAVTRERAVILIDSIDQGFSKASADQVLLDELTAIRTDSAEETPDQTDLRYTEAFHAWGIDLNSMAAGTAASAITSRPNRTRLQLCAALDGWSAVRRAIGNGLNADQVDAVSRLADNDSWRNRLRDASAENDLAKRREALKQLVKEITDETPFLNVDRLGVRLLDSGEKALAHDILHPARDREPGDLWLNIDLARSLEALGRGREAIRYMTAAQAIAPAAVHLLAHTFINIGETDQGIRLLRDLARRQPDQARHHSCLGRALQSQGRAQEAKVAIEKTIAVARDEARRHPESYATHYKLAYALERNGQTIPAIEEFREVIRRKPDLPQAHSGLGRCLLARGHPELAISECRLAIRLNPDFAEAHAGLGCAMRRNGQFPESITELQEAVRLEPHNAENYVALASSLIAAKQFDAAITASRQAIALKPDFPEAHSTLGDGYRHERDFKAAIGSYREALRINPNLALVRNNLGLLLGSSGRYDEAFKEFQTAARLNPDLATVHLSLGNFYRRKRQLNQAIVEYREALRLQPDYPQVHLNLIRVLEANGNIDEAIAAVHQARLKHPTDPNFSLELDKAVAKLESTRRMKKRLPAVIRGEDKPADISEQLEFALMCINENLNATAARIYRDAFTTEPALAADPKAQHLYNAACAAALAGCGKGKDDPPPNEPARVKLRHQALDWLKLELDAWTKLLETNAKSATVIAQTLQHWKVDQDLAGVRDRQELDKLPESERQSWLSLWSGVDQWLTKAGSK